MARKTSDESYSDKEAARRRDAVLKQMLNTPPQPRKQDSAKASKPKKRKT
jgi:hypothetical protein